MIDPLLFAKEFWPDTVFYREQRRILHSVRDNFETQVPAGNMLGKDFVAGYIALWFFLTNHPVRVLTTSVKDDHLRVLWGEIGRFIQTCRVPLEREKGGPLIINHRDIRKVVRGKECSISYLHGSVSQRGEGMAGHHAAHTLLLIDEASGVDDIVYNQGVTWAKRVLIIGNPNPCTNFFYRGVRSGDLPAQAGAKVKMYRKVIRIRAQDSPNVRYGEAELSANKPVTDKELVPGVLGFSEYQKRRATWDPIRACIGLDAEFYEGPEKLLFPPDWLNRAEAIARSLSEVGRRRMARAMGIDPAEGGDSSCWAIVDEYGLIKLISLKTPNTTQITSRTIALIREYGLSPKHVVFDRGGGGKEHADRLRLQGFDVRTVAFGEASSMGNIQFNRFMKITAQRRMDVENRYAYRNRRAEMYGLVRQMLDPDLNPEGFGLPAEYTELRRQLSPIPFQYDAEGRLILPPKTKNDVKSTKITLTDLIGHSPDEADALALAVFGMVYKPVRPVAGVMA